MTNSNDSNRPCVLIADDDRDQRDLLAQMLETYGYKVITSEDGEHAWKHLQESSVDAILLDVIMPGIDGYDLCRKIKQDPTLTHIPVLLISGLQSQVMRLRGIDAGADDLLSKPIDLNEIVVRLKSAVATKRRFEEVKASEGLEEEKVGAK